MLLKKRVWLGVGVVVLVGVLVGAVLHSQRDSEGPIYQGRTIKDWSMRLLSPTVAERDEAAATFRQLGPDAVPPLIKLLEARDPFFRKAMWSSTRAIPVRWRARILRHVRIPDAEVTHQAAAMALAVIGPPAKGAVPALSEVLHGKTPEATWAAADALGRIGAEALPCLMAASHDNSETVRQASVVAIGKLGANATAAIPSLIERLVDTNKTICAVAVLSLSQVGTSGIPFLVHEVEQKRGPARQSAARALALLPSRRLAEDSLLQMTRDDDVNSRVAALETLAAMHAGDQAAVAAMGVALKDSSPAVRLAAVTALRNVGLRAKPAIPALTEMLKDDSIPVRAAAAKALGGMGPAAAAALPSLAALATETNELTSPAAKEAMDKIGVKQ